MSSLKRILNPGAADGGYGEGFYGEHVQRKEFCQDETGSSEISVPASQSWSELFNGLLGTDYTDVEFLNLNDEVNSASFYNPQESIESGIESCAIKSLQQQPQQAPSLDPHLAAVETSIPTPLLDAKLPCYGMIYRVALRVVGDMLEVDAKLKAASRSIGNGLCTFSIGKSLTQVNVNHSTESTTQLNVRFQDGTVFGIISVHVSNALETLVDRQLVQFDVLGDALTLRDAISRATKAGDAVVRVNINVYGPQETSKEIGSHLSKHKVYLQRPDQQRPGSTYDNPHVLKFPGIQLTNLDQNLDVGNQRSAKPSNGEQFQKTIFDVYASLTRGTKLNRVAGDRRLGTTLLPHQQEALDFMVQRETGPIPTEFCLWKPMDGENKGRFCHAVTKAKTQTPGSETGGGILADEMGMGKTLSTLALIAKTLESSDEWVSTQSADMTDVSYGKKRPCRATLVIVPSAILINEWLKEVTMHLDGTLQTVKYHGQKRKALIPAMEEVDIVLTTYHTLVADFGDKSSPLHEIEWFRVVLDEAHIIRRQVTTFYRAVSDLKTRSRWCLTGTPIQNRLEDIGALFAFIGVRPFHNMATFRRYVTIPFDESEERRKVATRNLTLLLDSICLRRSRDLLHLPEPRNFVRSVQFSREERHHYEQTKRTMNKVLRHRVGESYTKSTFGMFQIQLQLRILCNHGTYQHEYSWLKRSLLDEREDALCLVGGSGEVNCSACRQSMPILGSNNVYRTYAGNCAHVLCSECLAEHEQIAGDTDGQVFTCPLCTVHGLPITVTGPRGITNDQDDSYLRKQGQSSKMEALISDIREDLWKTKSIVFSCWTNTLDLIERYLRKENISFDRIDGDCPLPRRQRILEGFSTTSSSRVLIMTTGTGAFGLNLTSANRVFIIEPQWNPSVENQAISRAIRLRQEKSVIVTRYVVEGTVEQEMRSQQERKLKIAGIGSNPSTQQP